MKTFSSEFLAQLNARLEAGTFLKAIEVSEDDDTTRYFVDFERAITYAGHEYLPLPMTWSGFEVERNMALPTMTIAVPSLDGTVIAWVEDLNVLERDVTLLILHLDQLGDSQAKDTLTLQIQGVQDDPGEGLCVFTLGLNLGLSDQLPRGLIMKADFPGIPDDRVRIQI